MKGGLSGQIDRGLRGKLQPQFEVFRIHRPKYGVDIGFLMAFGVLEIVPTPMTSGREAEQSLVLGWLIDGWDYAMDPDHRLKALSIVSMINSCCSSVNPE